MLENFAQLSLKTAAVDDGENDDNDDDLVDVLDKVALRFYGQTFIVIYSQIIAVGKLIRRKRCGLMTVDCPTNLVATATLMRLVKHEDHFAP